MIQTAIINANTIRCTALETGLEGIPQRKLSVAQQRGRKKGKMQASAEMQSSA